MISYLKKLAYLNKRKPEAFFISDTFVCAMKCDKFGASLRVVACGIEYFSENVDQYEIAQKIRQLSQRCLIPLKNVCVIVSMKDKLIKEIILPSMDESLINDVLPFEMVKNIPFDSEDIFYDFITIAPEDSSQLRILLGIILKDVYQNTLMKIKNYGIVHPIVPIKESLLGAYYCYQSETFSQESVLLIDLSDVFVPQFLFYEKGVLRFAKTISVEDNILQMESETMKLFLNDFCSQVEEGIVYFETIQKGTRPSYMKIYGFKDISDVMLNQICEQLRMKNLTCENAVEREYIFPFAYAMTCLKSIPILLPQKKSKKLDLFIDFFHHLLVFLSALFCIQLGVLFLFYKNYMNLSSIHKIYKEKKKYSNQLQSLIGQSKDIHGSASDLLNHRKHKNSILNLLNILMKYIPSGTFFSNLEKNSSGEVHIKGCSKKFLDLKRSLELCPFIHSLRVISLDNFEKINQEATYFELFFYFSKLSLEKSHGQK